MKIHLVEKLNNFKMINNNIWESSGWKLNESKAKKLIGGEIYFHKERQEPSFYGGTVKGYRVEQDGRNQGKIVFEFQYHQEVLFSDLLYSLQKATKHCRTGILNSGFLLKLASHHQD